MAETDERPAKVRKNSGGSFKESIQAQTESNLAAQTDAENTNTADTPDATEERPKLSKSQQKKLLRSQRWESGKEYRREKRREKNKTKQARKAELAREAEIAAAERAKLGLPEMKPEPIPEKRPRGNRAVQTPVALILDCDFDDKMTEKELISLGAQVTRCYSENRKSSYRAHLAISSWGGRMKERFETVLTRNHESWMGVTFHEGDFVDAAEKLNEKMQGKDGGKIIGALAGPDFKLKQKAGNVKKPAPVVEEMVAAPTFDPAPASDINGVTPASIASKKRSLSELDSNEEQAEKKSGEKESTTPAPIPELKPPSIIYLSSDSPHTLTTLEPNTSYIIGGIVDKNRHKGICYKRACERGIRTAKLPIGEYMTIQGRSVLAVNHVVEIMLKWLETGDWGEAFTSVIPKRKEAKLRVQQEQQSNGSNQGSVDEDEDADEDAMDDEHPIDEEASFLVAEKELSASADHDLDTEARLHDATETESHDTNGLTKGQES